MIGLAVLGLAVNGAAAWRLRRGRTLQSQMLTWHLVEDILGWGAVLVVAVILVFTDIHILDPLLSILITLYVLTGVLRNVRRTGAVFLQATPEELDLESLEADLAAIPGVLSTHHTHVWSLDGQHHVLTTHLVVPAAATKADIVKIKRNALRKLADLEVEHTTLEVEFEDEDCRMR
jgi:cobalt-zinc-cadmium efflux system protein